MRKAIVLVATAAALVVLLVASAGCGSSESSGDKPTASASPQWQQVLTREVSGERPIKLNLGTHDMGPGARLGWVLSGPGKKPPVILTFRIINQTNGVGYGRSVSPEDAGFSLEDESAIVLAPIWKGKYIVYFSQRFPAGKGPGYDVKLTVSTLK